jgi:hypothetical protein
MAIASAILSGENCWRYWLAASFSNFGSAEFAASDFASVAFSEAITFGEVPFTTWLNKAIVVSVPMKA